MRGVHTKYNREKDILGIQIGEGGDMLRDTGFGILERLDKQGNVTGILLKNYKKKEVKSRKNSIAKVKDVLN